MRRTLALAVALAVIVPAATQPAFAQSAEKRALGLFEQSLKRYQEGHYREAVDLLQQAYRLKPEPVLLYNLGRAYEGLGEQRLALEAYRNYLDKDPKAPDREAIESRIATLEHAIAEREQPPKPTAPGPAEPPPEKPVQPAAPDTVRKPSPVPWIVAATGAVTLGVGISLGVVSHARHEDAQAAPDALTTDDLQSQARGFATAANVLLFLGTVTSAVGVVWGTVDLANSGKAARTSDKGASSRRMEGEPMHRAITVRTGVGAMSIQYQF